MQALEQWEGIEAQSATLVTQQALPVQDAPRLTRRDHGLEGQAKVPALQFVVEQVGALQVVQGSGSHGRH